MYYKKQITENSWILYVDKSPSALLYKDDNEKFILTFGEDTFIFDTDEELQNSIGKIKTIENETFNKEIEGYPVRHSEWFIEAKSPPSYNTGGNIIFNAGFYIIKNSEKWNIVFCPKQSTLSKNTHKGPYKSRLEAIRETKIA